MKSIWNKLISAAVLISLPVQIYFRYKLTLNRYFDVDEFAHLHWGFNFLAGAMPYRDYFYIFPPYFLLPLAAIAAIFGREAETLIITRGFIFLVQLTAYLILFLWAKKLRGVLTALLTVVIFIFLPLPSDKLLEIRPDLLATVAAMAGMYLFIGAAPQSGTSEKKKKILYFFSGFLFSASAAIVPKTVFFLLPVAAVSLYRFRRDYLYMAIGAGINLIIVLAFFAVSGKFFLAMYLTTKLANEVTRVLASKFYMRPDIFFYPNDTFYGAPGISQTLIVNLVIYFFGIVWGIKNLVSSLSYKDDKKCVREFVFSTALIVNLFAFVKVYPLKHLQYLIPVAPFAAFYFADMLRAIGDRLGRIKVMILLLFIGYITYLSFVMYRYKLPWVNKPAIDKLNGLLTAVPAGEPIFDLTGETVFYPDGYYFCCLPYGQYEEALNFDYPDLPEEIRRRQTKYVHTGKTDRLEVLPATHARYIRENFIDYKIPGVLIRK